MLHVCGDDYLDTTDDFLGSFAPEYNYFNVLEDVLVRRVDLDFI